MKVSLTPFVAAVAALSFVAGTSLPAAADFLQVPRDYPTIQAAIDAAPEGAVISVAAGVYVENIDFKGKLLVVEGDGPDSILQGTGTGPVVTFTNGESGLTTLDSFTITGGLSSTGGGIRIIGSHPRILRNVIVGNSSTGQGSGIYVSNGSAPLISNNLMMFNTGVNGSDPHTIQVNSSSPRIINNTIVRNDSNAILTSGSGVPEIRNNILARNGIRLEGVGVKGRGICDFAPNTITQYNLFFRNARAALLTAGTDFRTIRRAQRELQRARLLNNIDARLGFSAGPLPKTIEEATVDRFIPSEDPLRPSAALHAGDPSPEYDNVGGGRNTIGFTGGPFAPPF